MPTGLKIADNYTVPMDLVTSTQAIVARKRSGKSYTASVEAEEMMDRGIQVAVIDPTSAWWGLRSSSDGNGPGYPIVVFGGDHADAPLNFRTGKEMARALVEHGFSAIFDIGGWETDEQIEFVYRFSQEILRINRMSLHLFIDEADTFAPQLLEGKEQKKCLGAASRLVKQGGIKGLGITLITQRSADLNKKLLSQIDRLTVLCMRHPPDIKPVTDWVSTNITPQMASTINQALPRLAVGEAWICDGPNGEATPVRIRQRRTFNSGATPKPGQKRVEPKVLAAVDIQRLGKQIADSIEQERANSPEELKRRIAVLENQLKTAKPVIDKDTIAKMVDDGVRALNQTYQADRQKLVALYNDLRGSLQQIQTWAGHGLSLELPELPKQLLTELPARTTSLAQPTRAYVQPPLSSEQKTTSKFSHEMHWNKAIDNSKVQPLGRGEKTVLMAIAGYSDGVEGDTLSVLTGYKRSSRDTYIQRLREKNLVEKFGSVVRATDEGIEALGSDYELLPVGIKLQEYWMGRLPEGEKRVLSILINAYPQAMRRDQLDEQTGYKRSSRDTYLQRLSARRLVHSIGSGSVQASDHLF